MGTPLHSQFLAFNSLILLLFISFNVQLNHATSTTTVLAKDQVSCTMCSSCDNPCQPIFSPPPPSPPPSLPCPPPPSLPPPPSPPQPCLGGCSQPMTPPYSGGGSGGGNDDYYFSPTNPSMYPIPPPPNPIVPYFPFYFYNPPAPNTIDSKSVHFKNHHPFITCLIILVSILLFL
ncbi:putative proline-rich protein-like [Capsicum galapagoense]